MWHHGLITGILIARQFKASFVSFRPGLGWLPLLLAFAIVIGNYPPTTRVGAQTVEFSELLILHSTPLNSSDAAEPTSTTFSDEPSLAAKLAALEAEWDKFQFDRTEQLAAEAEKVTRRSSYTLNGRVHLDYWSFPKTDQGINFIETGDANSDPEDRFAFRRLRLELAGKVPEDMFFRMQVDFNNPQTPEIKDAYLGWELPRNHALIFGNQKRPLGLDHLNSSRFNVFAERPLAVEAFNEDARRLGLCMYAGTDDQSTNWAYGLYSLSNISTDGRYIGDVSQMGGYGRFWRSPWYSEESGGRGYWHWAIAGAVAKPDGEAGPLDPHQNEARFRTRPLARSDRRWLDTGRIQGAQWFEILGFENILNIGPLQITGEYLFATVKRDGLASDDEALFFHGGYAYVSYFLTGEYIPYDRADGQIGRVFPNNNFSLIDKGDGTGWGAWQIALRYDYLDLTDSNVGGGVGSMVTAGLNWHWNPYSKVQNNLIFGDIAQSDLAGPFDGGQFVSFGSRFMIDF